LLVNCYEYPYFQASSVDAWSGGIGSDYLEYFSFL
jgi:hypothetical protein